MDPFRQEEDEDRGCLYLYYHGSQLRGNGPYPLFSDDPSPFKKGTYTRRKAIGLEAAIRLLVRELSRSQFFTNINPAPILCFDCGQEIPEEAAAEAERHIEVEEFGHRAERFYLCPECAQKSEAAQAEITNDFKGEWNT
jgi:hypothetical protein